MSGGFRNLMWYVGVVEDRHDATNDGRIKVRAFGIHTEDKQAMPTADLPWAIVLDGSYGAAQKIPDVGDWVFGFFMDGDDAQHPMVMGRIPGINLQLPPEAGAPKEANYAPVESIPKIGVPPLHRHLGGEHAEKGQGPLQAAAVKNGIETATGETWSEPPIISPEKNLDNTIYTSKNDNNYVVLSDSREGDGTYILISHASGSAVQIDSHGTILVKSFGDTYNSSEGFTMNRTELDSHTNVGGDWSVKVERGSGKIWINGDLDIECENFNVTARGSANINAAAGTNISGGKVGLFATSDDINLAANANIKMKAGTLLNGGGIYGQALFGDVHFDSYKMNLYSTSYMKLTALGTPAVSTQTVPYADATQKGIEINSPVLVSLNGGVGAVQVAAATTAIYGAVKAQMTGGIVDVKSSGILNLSSTGIASLDGSLVNIGMGTGDTSPATLTAIATLRGTQVALNAALPSITEIATVVNPGDIPPSRVPVGHTTNSAFRTRRPPPATSRMGDDTTDGSPDPQKVSFANAATAIAKRGSYSSSDALDKDVEFQAQLTDMLQKYPGLTKEELYRVMQGESNFNSTALNSDSGATGLFQFIPSTAEFLGYTTGDIQNMNPSEQLAVYDKYLGAFDYRGGPLGIMQAAPAYASKPGNYEVYASGSKAYEQNPGWRGSDGKITVSSINDYYTQQQLG
jgi:hypothetical protein